MVALTNEEAWEMKKRSMEPEDAIPQWKREVLGNSARLDIPLDNIYLLRKVGPLIAGLAEHIKFTAQRSDLSEYELLSSIRSEVRATAKHIQILHGGALKNGNYPKRKD